MIFIINGAVLMSGRLVEANAGGKLNEGIESLRTDLRYSDSAPLAISAISIEPHRPLIAEMLLCRVVDNFLVYIVELLALIYNTRPEMLRMGEHIAVDEVLQHADMESLRRFIAERRVERLSYLGMRELIKSIKEQHGFDLMPSTGDLERAILLVEMRNLIVHSRGVVNRLAGARAPELSSQVGHRIPLKYDDVAGHREFLQRQVERIDAAAVRKFHLPTLKPSNEDN